MKGTLIIYNTNSNGDVARINHALFGRIVKVKNTYYYYSGFLESTPYAKLTNGCYFIYANVEVNVDNIKAYSISVDVGELYLITAKDKWNDFAKKEGIVVRNL